MGRREEQAERDAILNGFAGEILDRNLGTAVSLDSQPEGPARILDFAAGRLHLLDEVRGRWTPEGELSPFGPLVWRWKNQRRRWRMRGGVAVEEGEAAGAPEPASDSPWDAPPTAEAAPAADAKPPLVTAAGTPSRSGGAPSAMETAPHIEKSVPRQPREALPERRPTSPHAAAENAGQILPGVAPERQGAAPILPDVAPEQQGAALAPVIDAAPIHRAAARAVPGSKAPRPLPRADSAGPELPGPARPAAAGATPERSNRANGAPRERDRTDVARSTGAEFIPPAPTVSSTPASPHDERIPPVAPALPDPARPAAARRIEGESSASVPKPVLRETAQSFRVRRALGEERPSPTFRLLEPLAPESAQPSPGLPRDALDLAQPSGAPVSETVRAARSPLPLAERPSISTARATSVPASESFSPSRAEPDEPAGAPAYAPTRYRAAPAARREPDIAPASLPVQRRAKQLEPSLPGPREFARPFWSAPAAQPGRSGFEGSALPAVQRQDAGESGGSEAKPADAKQPPASAGAASDIDEIVDRALEKLARTLAIESERRGVSSWH